MNRHRLLQALRIGAVAVWLGVPAGTYGQDSPGIQRVRLNGPFSGWPVKLPDGCVATYYVDKASEYIGQAPTTDRAAAEASVLLCRHSQDQGLTWGPPETVGPGGLATSFTFVDAKGGIHLFGYSFFPPGQRDYGDMFKDWRDSAERTPRMDLWHKVSRNGGKSWSASRKIDYGHRYTGSINSVTLLSTGRVLLPFSFLSERRTGRFACDVLISDDDGRTWRNAQNVVVVDSGGTALESGAVEPVTVELPDKRVWMVIRTQTGWLYESYSTDGGETFSAARPSRFRASNSPAHLLRLRDGRVVIVWNNCVGGLNVSSGNLYARETLVVAINDAEGRWHGYREVAHPGPHDHALNSLHYPHLTELPDGRIMVLYSKLDYDFTVHHRGEKHTDPSYPHEAVIVSPDWIMEKELVETWPRGLADWTITPQGPVIEKDKQGAPVLRLKKPDPSSAAGATRNIPFGQSGELNMEVSIPRGFGGAYLALSETYLSPHDRCGGMFRIQIAPDGRVLTQYENERAYRRTAGRLQPGKWHHLTIRWDTGTRQTLLWLDDTSCIPLLPLDVGRGISYLRLHSAAQGADADGLAVRSIKVAVP